MSFQSQPYCVRCAQLHLQASQQIQYLYLAWYNERLANLHMEFLIQDHQRQLNGFQSKLSRVILITQAGLLRTQS